VTWEASGWEEQKWVVHASQLGYANRDTTQATSSEDRSYNVRWLSESKRFMAREITKNTHKTLCPKYRTSD
jgi:hypothetical protein